ncbi:MAG: transketolase [Candidatus Woykebacteria bacterium GWA1_44_8]|uniref:Transketolase n=2 Tax=Candidatus Woykeibacteriota TaxID=1817899 RepID=A0A1G1W4X3_9BACT|nr:MAG: transketolase [Candidatus Woykebacteria bacterium GWA1_44_8]
MIKAGQDEHIGHTNVGILEKIANDIRQDVIKMLLEAKSGHSAGSLGMADIFAALYFAVLNHNPKNPKWEDRDRLLTSNGHICPVVYAALAHAGYFPREELTTLRKINSRLQGHPHYGTLPGIENTSGPLGQGLPQAIGMALACRMDKKRYYVFCTLGDGELDEGQIWEAVMFAGKNELGNLIGIVDRNNIQIDGFTEDVMPLEPLRSKFEDFGWHVQEVDGHNIQAIIDACHEAKAIFNKPSMLIAHTIPGKGVDFMEWQPSWHGKPPNPEEAKKALNELRTLKGRIVSEHE